VAAAQQAKVVGAMQDENLGHGYRLKWRHVDLSKCKTCFEGMAHYTDLYWRGNRIGKQVGEHFMSPSGKYVLFEQSGKLMLFVATPKKTVDVTDGTFALPRSVNWQEKERRATVTYYQKHNPSSIRLDSD
jgi:hypothetical protein